MRRRDFDGEPAGGHGTSAVMMTSLTGFALRHRRWFIGF
jgi:hypothetical protein